MMKIQRYSSEENTGSIAGQTWNEMIFHFNTKENADDMPIWNHSAINSRLEPSCNKATLCLGLE